MGRIQAIFFILINLLIPLHSGADEPATAGHFFSNAEREAVLKGEIITKGFLKDISKVHTPNTDALINIPVSKYTEEELQSYEMLCMEKAFFKYELTANSKLLLYNTLAAFSKLSGMEYYSRLDKKTKVLINDCHRIESAADTKRVKDNIYGSIIPEAVNYFKTTDNRFGDLVFRSELYNEDDNFILKNVCVQPLEKFFISVNRSGEYQLISFFIYDADVKGYFYYSINAMKIRSGFFLNLGKLSAGSFANRIRSNTVRMAKLLGFDWQDRLKAFE